MRDQFFTMIADMSRAAYQAGGNRFTGNVVRAMFSKQVQSEVIWEDLAISSATVSQAEQHRLIRYRSIMRILLEAMESARPIPADAPRSARHSNVISAHFRHSRNYITTANQAIVARLPVSTFRRLPAGERQAALANASPTLPAQRPLARSTPAGAPKLTLGTGMENIPSSAESSDDENAES